MSDPTAGEHRPPGRPPRGAAGRDDPGAAPDPGAMAKADVRAILARALGLRRIVELAAEISGSGDGAPVEPSRAHRPGRPQLG